MNITLKVGSDLSDYASDDGAWIEKLHGEYRPEDEMCPVIPDRSKLATSLHEQRLRAQIRGVGASPESPDELKLRMSLLHQQYIGSRALAEERDALFAATDYMAVSMNSANNMPF